MTVTKAGSLLARALLPLAGAVGVLLATPSPARACLWDSDTLLMEQRRFPGVLEIISGQFARHSRAYYLWRIADRTPKIEANAASAPLFDDVAVAWEKLGEHAKAIYVESVLETIAPGRYETYANVGTFYLHSGDFPHGIAFIDRALQINPGAHFGREIYQRALAEYVSSKRVGALLPLPLRPVGEILEHGYLPPGGFAAFLEQKRIPRDAPAVKGVLGMLVFGDATSPVLLEALADLLLAPPANVVIGEGTRSSAMIPAVYTDAKHLAALAYLRAEQSAVDASAKRDYHRFALAQGATTPPGLVEPPIARVFSQQVALGDKLEAQVERNEQLWIDQGKDLDREFAAFYARSSVPAAVR